MRLILYHRLLPASEHPLQHTPYFPLEPPPFYDPSLKTFIDSDRRACLQALPQYFAPPHIQAHETCVDTRIKAEPMARQKTLIEDKRGIRLRPNLLGLIVVFAVRRLRRSPPESYTQGQTIGS